MMVTRLEEETRIGKGGTLAAQLSRLDLIVLDELGTQRKAIFNKPASYYLKRGSLFDADRGSLLNAV
ncbi:hypothetical protein A8O16_13855 [Sphingobium sp. 20006FA]|nr:hypothetical protein A8O16_13855 [Sphingobium sp. 20006FA]